MNQLNIVEYLHNCFKAFGEIKSGPFTVSKEDYRKISIVLKMFKISIFHVDSSSIRNLSLSPLRHFISLIP